MPVNYFTLLRDPSDLNPSDLGAPGTAAPGLLLSGSDAGRVNLLPNPSFEVNTAGWATGIGTLSRVTSDHVVGSACLQLVDTYTGGSFNSVNPYPTAVIPVAPGLDYAVSGHAKPDEGPRSFRVEGRWTDASHAQVSTISGSPVSCPANTWTRVGHVATAPEGAAFLEFSAGTSILNATDDPGGDNDTYLFDAFMVEQASEVGTYLDGQTPVPAIPAASTPFTPGWWTFIALRDPEHVGDDSGDPLADQVYRHAAPMLGTLGWRWYAEGLLGWPAPSGHEVVPVTGTPVGGEGGYYYFDSLTVGSGTGTVRQMLSGAEGSTRKVAAILDLLDATSSANRTTIASTASANAAAIAAAREHLQAVGATDPWDLTEGSRQFNLRSPFAAMLAQAAVGYGSAAGYAAQDAMLAVVAKEAGLIGATFTEANYQTMTDPIDAVLAMPSGY